MRSKLNPDGARIRNLRIQRGWTQEQLAEIAGVSSRTVQRAETANCAAFETVRAIAGAFETDFDQLLKPESHKASDPRPQSVNSAHMTSSAPAIEQIPVDLPKPPVRRVWEMPLLLVSTLVLGLVIGVSLKSHFDVTKKSRPSGHAGISEITRQIEAPREPVQPVLTLTRKKEPARKAPSALTKAVVPNHKLDIAGTALNMSPAEQPVETTVRADPDLRDSIQPPESASLDLSLQSQSLLSELVIPKAPVASPDPSVLSGNGTLDEPDPGAVERAVDLAAKKTGTFVSKVSASLKRVF